MGTIVYRATKAQAMTRELADIASHCTVLAQRLVGPRLWYLAERANVRWIGLVLIEVRGAEVAVKHMDETLGPYYYDCPLSFLDRASAPHGEHAAPWREKVRAFHALRATQRDQRSRACIGQRVRLDKQVYVLQQSLGRKGWAVSREVDGVRMRMLSRHIRQVEWLPALAQSPASPPEVSGSPGFSPQPT